MIRAVLILLLFANSVVAQDLWDVVAPTEVTQTQVVFLKAAKAELADVYGKVAIIAEELSEAREYGVIVTLPTEVKWIEVHPAAKPFPPIVQMPFKEGRFLIRGVPGERFYVSSRGGDRPLWFETIVAAGDNQTPPTDPGPVDPKPDPSPPSGTILDQIRELSRQKSAALDDAATAAVLRETIQRVADAVRAKCRAGQCPTLDGAKTMMVQSIDVAMLGRTSPNRDWWLNWRRPVSDVIKKANPADVESYLTMMQAAAEGL
ncbi:hypothetical protein SH501x_000809 [Pirellulaceae bacterium SH501]